MGDRKTEDYVRPCREESTVKEVKEVWRRLSIKWIKSDDQEAGVEKCYEGLCYGVNVYDE